MRALRCLFLIAALIASEACAPKLEPGFEVEGGDFVDSDIYTVAHDDGTKTTQVQAVSKEDWIYFDFETESETSVDDPAWDLAFQRFKVQVSPAGGVVTLKDQAFADVTGADGFEPEIAGDWYYYNLQNHTLTTRGYVYVVRTGEGGLFKLTFVAYYDSTGSGGFPAFDWQRL